MSSNSSGNPPAAVLQGPAPQANTILASMRAYNQEQWKHYTIDSLTINTKTLAITCPLDNHLSVPPRPTPVTSPLLSLPPEILHLILRHLSIHTLTQIRRVSTHFRSLISSNPLYYPIYTHAPSSLRAILSTGIGPHISLQELHTALTTLSCSLCSKFGDFLNLLTRTRICHACFATSPSQLYHANVVETHILPTPLSLAKSAYGLSSATLSALPVVRTIPGVYGREKSNFRRKRFRLCLVSAARELGIAQHGSLKAMNDFVLRQREKEAEKQEKRWEKSDWASGVAVIGSSVPDLTVEGRGWDNPFRHMVVVRFPWVRKRGLEDAEEEGDVVEWGVVCEVCREKAKHEEDGEKRWNVRYSSEGLVEHLKGCLQA